RFGSQANAQLLARLQPRHWFSAHMHVKYAAVRRHESGRETRFLALDKILPRRGFLQMLDIDGANGANAAAPLEFAYDAEWLAVVQRTHDLMRPRVATPRPPVVAVSDADVAALRAHCRRVLGIADEAAPLALSDRAFVITL